MSNQKPQALAGIKILDLARLGPGPHSSQILGDFGAEVITVEPPISKKGVALKIPRGAPIRRNTRSIRLNLKNGRGQEILKKQWELLRILKKIKLLLLVRMKLLFFEILPI